MNFDPLPLAGLQQQLWLLMALSLRCGAAMFAAPLFGAHSVPVQLRAMLGMALALFVQAWMPAPQLPPMMSVAAVMMALQEVAIGLAMGFILQIAFAIPMIAAEQISGTMGLAIATSIDPNSGSQSGAVGQYFSLLMTLLFLSLGAHLVWFELLMDSYRVMPPGRFAFSAADASAIVEFGGYALLAAATIALPVVLVLLLVQIVTGVLSRSAPSLNLFALGLPAGVLAGLAALIATVGIVSEQFTQVTADALAQVEGLARK